MCEETSAVGDPIAPAQLEITADILAWFLSRPTIPTLSERDLVAGALRQAWVARPSCRDRGWPSNTGEPVILIWPAAQPVPASLYLPEVTRIDQLGPSRDPAYPEAQTLSVGTAAGTNPVEVMRKLVREEGVLSVLLDPPMWFLGATPSHSLWIEAWRDGFCLTVVADIENGGPKVWAFFYSKEGQLEKVREALYPFPPHASYREEEGLPPTFSPH